MLAAQTTSGGCCARLDVHFIHTLPVAATPWWMAALLLLGLLHRPRAWLMAHAIERYIEHESWQVAAIQTAVDELDKGQADLVDHATVDGG